MNDAVEVWMQYILEKNGHVLLKDEVLTYLRVRAALFITFHLFRGKGKKYWHIAGTELTFSSEKVKPTAVGLSLSNQGNAAAIV